MTKVCIFSSVHSPFDIRIFHKEAKSLVKEGYDVTLIAQHDREEIVDGVKIINLQRPRNRIERVTKTAWSAFRKALEVDADIYHFHDPELLPIGLKLRRLGKKVIFDIHEDTRQQIILKKYIPLPLRFFVSRAYALYEDYACRKFSALVTPQQKMTFHYSSLNITATVENFADLSLYSQRVLDFSKPVLLHAGSLTADRGLFNMVNAAKKISGDFLFYVAGKFHDNISISSLSPLLYLGVLDQKSIVNIYRESNIGIILYNNVGQYSMAGAVKCYEYMANSMPVIMPNFGEWIEFNKKHKCGINVDVLNAESVAASVNYLIDNPEKARQMGENGRKLVTTNCSWQIAFEKLHELYRNVLAQRGLNNV
jgi:glycosyltransferase involved in cell wall biosynthesis